MALFLSSAWSFAQENANAQDLPPEKAFFVAPGGSDSGFGTIEKPFATIAKAQEAVRLYRRVRNNTDETVIIVLRGGTYFFDEPIRLKPEDSGTENSLTVYEAYENESVVLSGSRPISGFRETEPGRWETRIPDVAEGKWYFSQLFVNNRRCSRPVVPENTYYLFDGSVPPTQQGGNPDRFRFRQGDIDPNWRNLDDIEIETFHKWTMDHLRIKSIDPEKRIVTLTGPTHSTSQAPLKSPTNYRLTNVKEALSKPGQWYLDRKTGVLTVLARPGFDMNKAIVLAPIIPRILSIEGDYENDRYVEYVAFKGLTFAHTAWETPPRGHGFPQADVGLDGAITLTGARNCIFGECDIRHTGNYGIDISDGCSGIAVVKCELFDLGAGGIKIGPNRLGGENNEKKWCTECSVTDSLIAHGGRIHAEGVGVWIGHASHCQIEQNEIYDFYYSGVSVGWKWGPGFSPAHHNRIAWNHIHTLGQGVLDDMAGIYTLGESPGTHLLGNLIHDVRRVNYGGWGLYYDESSRGIVAERNIVYKTQDGSFHQHYGLENIVRNNIFADAENGLAAISNLQKSGPLTFERNIFYMLPDQNVWEKDQLREDTAFRSNLYWKVGGVPFKFFGYRDLEQWKKDKEPDAQVADPLFTNPAEGDYSLRPDSPAAKLIGFEQIDFARPGRSEKTYRTVKLPIPTPAFPPGIPQTEISKNQAYKEDFERYEPGEMYGDMNVESFKESICLVTDKHGAGSSGRCVEFRKGTDSKYAWQPHLSTYLNYTTEPSRSFACAFDIYVEKGTKMNFEIRDWRKSLGGRYKTGLSLSIDENGRISSQGAPWGTVAVDGWTHITMEIHPDRKAFRVGFVDADGKQEYRDVPVVEGFEYPSWLGFMTLGEPGSGFFIDNLEVENKQATPITVQ